MRGVLRASRDMHLGLRRRLRYWPARRRDWRGSCREGAAIGGVLAPCLSARAAGNGRAAGPCTAWWRRERTASRGAVLLDAGEHHASVCARSVHSGTRAVRLPPFLGRSPRCSVQVTATPSDARSMGAANGSLIGQHARKWRGAWVLHRDAVVLRHDEAGANSSQLCLVLRGGYCAGAASQQDV